MSNQIVEIKKILVPTDFSDASDDAYTHAQELAQKYGAKIDLIHVVPVLKYFAESFNRLGVPFNMDEDFYPHVKEKAEYQLQGLMKRFIRKENQGKFVVLIHRKPSSAIVDYANKQGHDLIVMSALGGHGSEFFRGEVTQHVIRHSTVPVIAVDNRLLSGGIKRILIPTDASLVSFACFPLALTLAEVYDAEITLFHVLELYGSLSESITLEFDKPKESTIYESVIDGLTEYLINEGWNNISIERKQEDFTDEIVVKHDDSEVVIPLKTVIEKGISAHYVIENYTPDHTDMIVMTTHGHTGLAHLFLGSTAEMVVRHAKVPVVTLKPSEHLLKTEPAG